MMTIQFQKKSVLIFLLILLLMVDAFASGSNEQGYIQIASQSDDKKAVMKAHALVLKQLDKVTQTFTNEANERKSQLLQLYNIQKEVIESSQPYIWETDSQFHNRKEDEFAELTSRFNDEYISIIHDLSSNYDNKIDTLLGQLKTTTLQLEKPTSIQIVGQEALEFKPYLRNDRIWPIAVTFSDTLIPATTITALIDFAGIERTEQTIRTAIVEFDAYVTEDSLRAKIEYHIVPNYQAESSGPLEPQFLVVMDALSILDASGRSLYSRTLKTPMLMHTFRVDEKNSILFNDNEKAPATKHYTYTDFDGNNQEVLSSQNPILLVPPSEKISSDYEQSRLSAVNPKTLFPANSKQTVFRIANGAEPESLDPALIMGVPEHRIIEALFEGLVGIDPVTANAIPGVAESWKPNKDGTQYTFKLRKNAVWSDGTPITANDVVYSWLRLLDPATAGPYAWFPCMFLAGATEFNAGEAGPEAVGIRALDDYTFQMDLIGPLPYAVDALTHYSFAIVPKHAIEKFGAAWTDPANFVGNGPFVLSERVAQTSLTATKNPKYWDADAVKLDKVIFYSSDNDTTNCSMYLNGEIDWATYVPFDQLNAAQMRDDFQLAPQLATYYYVFQTEKAPINNPLVRKALSYAVDREALVEGVTKAGQIPAWGIVPPMTGYPGLEFPFDSMGEAIKIAQRMLAQAGYPNGVGFPTVSILYNTNEGHKQIAEFIQQEWRNNLGIRVRLENQEWQTYLSNRNEGNFQVARAGWVGDYQDPNTFLDMFITGAGMNGGKYSNEIYDILINEAARMPAGEDRFGVLSTNEDIMINEDQAIMPLYYYVTINMIDTNKWGGWHNNTMDYHPIKNIYPR